MSIQSFIYVLCFVLFALLQTRETFVFGAQGITYLEIGANNGAWTVSKMKDATTALKTTCFMFEPQPHLFSQLSAIATSYNCSVVTRPAWTHEAEMEFHVHQDDVASSLIPGLLSKKNDTSKPKTFNVPTIDLALWISKNVDPKDFVHVRMDIEGAEYMVLRRLIVTGVACKYFNVLEVEFHALHTKSNYAMRPADVVLPWILRGCGMKVLHAAYYPKELYDMTGDSPCNECELLKTILPNTPGGQGEKLVNEAYP
ncbi:hypothetical protein CEUSTIGMA_g10070.t1 [Chlamydomonas eustigma]|uniref:Methyltransferase FkbM domain-containing protein n=1 Tax=Chlamydomonas eustigma TaxID=1157962 RepID=A0A250XHT8_9CHLO|nr:hypothetical protein CEUSTIGMA_g10070.t1 [Chlamydomonas eustigma]|eukprot:GAX82644.1 hypothetical protein CEUSTIGMA_g10070.t1 [Chlamydomonas eustigma]